MGSVHRAIDRLTGQVVTLKRVLAPMEGSNASDARPQEERLALAREFQVLAGLRHPNIISVLDYGFDDGQPFFTMDLQEAAAPFVEAARGQPLPVVADLLVQLLHALAYMHRRGILHRDLKPSNVLVVRGVVKVLDFGISISSEEAGSSSIIEGTLAYMAPEVLSGRPPSREADLYAVGVMAYEMLVGRHPFHARNQAEFLAKLARERPRLDSELVEPALGAVLGRLLSNVPADRYGGDAEAVIHALAAALGRDLYLQTPMIRESYLQTAPLVGRAAELARIRQQLRATLEGRPGGTLLLGGESGVGKSRVLSEARTLGMVRGALVLSGQAVSEGGGPFRALREPLRWMALLGELDDQEAGVLRAAVPDLAGLLGRSVPAAPPLEAGANLNRLLDTIEALFRRQTQPLLLVLEDLQWASDESMLALRRLVQLSGEHPLLILGSYRDEEAPRLPERLPGAERLPVARLTESAVRELSRFMLGPPGETPAVVELLCRETEGNAYFLVEAVRTLLDARDQSGRIDLPERLISGGVRRIALRRLSLIEPEDLPLLQRAAILGRRPDLDVLGALAQGEDLDAWITRMANAIVLERGELGWRFTHDKLREVLIERLDEDASLRRALHAEVAAAMERVSRDDAARAPALAWHWRRAGDPERELSWCVLAGDLALQSSSYSDAGRLRERALELVGASGGDVGTRARWRLELAECAHIAGQYAVSREQLRQVLELSGVHLPETPRATQRLLLWQVLVQIRHLLLPPRAPGTEQRHAILVESSRAAARLAWQAIMDSDQVGVLAYSLLAVNLADRARHTVPYALGVAAVAAATMGANGLAQRWFARAREAAAADEYTLVEVAMLETSVLVGLSRFPEAQAIIDANIERAVRIQHRKGEAYLYSIRGLIHWYIADIAEAVPPMIATLDAVGRAGSDGPALIPSIAIFLALRGSGARGLEMVEQGWPYVLPNQSIVRRTMTAARVLVLGQLGRSEEALRWAREMLSWGGSPGDIPALCQFVYSGLCEATLAGLRAARSPEDLAAATRDNQAALRAFSAWARLYPVGRPELLRYRGLLEQAQGRTERARATLEESVRRAQAGGQRLHEALGELALGGLTSLPADRRGQHLSRARALLEGAGMPAHLRRVDEALAWLGEA